MINKLRIENFKSIKKIEMNPRRVNIIIGAPNVGKSNILEALAISSCQFDSRNDKFMSEFVRYENMFNLFYDNDVSNDIEITTNFFKTILYKVDGGSFGYKYNSMSVGLFLAIVKSVRDNSSSLFMDYISDLDLKNINEHWMDDDSNFNEIITQLDRAHRPYNYTKATIDANGRASITTKGGLLNAIPKKYEFKNINDHKDRSWFSFLEPPLGKNMLEVVQSNISLRKDIVELFKPYGLQLVLRMEDRKFEIQKNIDGFVYTYPYSSIADTLQRIIFYSAAIQSNQQSVLVFEEPETRSFPVQISQLGDKIVDSETNQFFIATHSPYLVTEILEKMLPYESKAMDLAVYVAYYENFETKIKMLTDEEVKEIRNDSIDVFYNMDRFTPGNNNYA